MAVGDITMSAEHDGERVEFTGRQLSMLGRHPEMDEHVEMVRDKAQEIASRLLDDLNLTAAITVGTKIATQIVTDEGIVMDAVISIKIDAKPAKQD